MLHKRSLVRSVHKHGKGHDSSWAVSYADFLMVLLSFFIIFFSTDKQSPLHRLILDLSTKERAARGVAQVSSDTLPNGSAIGDAVKDNKENNQNRFKFSMISEEFKDVKIESSDAPEQISIFLPDNIYPKGAYLAPETELLGIVNKLKKYSKEISITVVGHSDATKFSVSTPVIQANNLTLASVRAAYASIYIQNKLPEVSVSSQAFNSKNRESRSLTIVIKPKAIGENL